jgi:hypothetical protein
MSHYPTLHFDRVEVTLKQGGVIENIKRDLVKMAMDHDCYVKAEFYEGDTFEVDCETLMSQGVPPPA